MNVVFKKTAGKKEEKIALIFWINFALQIKIRVLY